MGMRFTPDQQRVIEVRDKNILVSAAAGSGKTAVLVERIIGLISNEKKPVDIDRLLVVTFTNAAAAEMRERIGRAIAEKLAENPGSAHLQKQAVLLHHAQITTIDSFCMYVLRNHFNDIGLDPGFRVADEGEMKLLKRDVLAALLEECFAQADPDFLYLADCYSGGRGKQLEDIVLQLYGFAESYPWPEEWLEQRCQDYRITTVEQLEQAPFTAGFLAHMKAVSGGYGAQLRQALLLCEQPDGPYFYARALEADMTCLKRLEEADSLTELEAAFGSLVFEKLSSKRDPSVDPGKREQVKAVRDKIKKALTAMQNAYFDKPLSAAAAQMGLCGRYVEALARLVLSYRKRVDEKKREKNIIDFGDMEHLALRILVERRADGSCRASATAAQFRRHFVEILIDEYQDSNLVQEYLLASISGEEDGVFNRFMVGDVKQSIYRFRLARPELFLEKQDSYPADRTGSRELICLSQNFRSRPQVLDSVNRIFYRLMAKQLGGVEYDAAAALYPGAEYPDATELHSGTLAAGDEADYKTELLLAVEDAGKEQEARMVAARIRELVGRFPVLDRETGLCRKAAYKDIVILLRSPAGWDETFRQTLQDAGIPVHLTAKTGYFASAEVQAVLQYLQILDNPLQDIPLFGVLKSYFGGFTEVEIAALRASGGSRKKKLYTCMQEAAALTDGAASLNVPEGCDPEALAEKCRCFLERYEALRRNVPYLPIHKLVRELIESTGYLYHVAVLPAGKQRLANVEMLLERAEAFTKTSYFGLFHFLRYMEQVEKYDIDYGEANILDEHADTVRLMSIHKSKGLEFPICFVCGLGRRFNRQESAQAVIADMDLGLGVDYLDPVHRIKAGTLRKKVLAEKLRLDGLGEELRVLYVAMTRAREKLILTGCREGYELPEEAAVCREEAGDCEDQGIFAGLQRLPYTLINDAGCYLDFLLPAARGAVTLKLFTKEQLEKTEQKDQIRDAFDRLRLEEELKMPGDGGLQKRLQEKFFYRYPHEDLQALCTKTTVSELKMAHLQESGEPAAQLFEEEVISPYVPGFLRQEEPEKVSGSERGSAYHKVLELWDFAGSASGRQKRERKKEQPDGKEAPAVSQKKAVDTSIPSEKKAPDSEEIRNRLQDMADTGRLPSAYLPLVQPFKIRQFLDSPLAGRMTAAARSGCLYREQPFVLGVAANLLQPEFPPEETVLIQGIIDVWFEEEDGIVVADYKTDAVREEKELVRRYALQLDYYAQALERLTGRKVKEKVIYSFALGREILL